MRKSYLLLAGASAVLLAACSSDKKTSMDDDLKKSLELASSSDGITLANSSNASTQVVSAIERTTPPVKQQAPSTKVRRHKPAPKSPPQVVRANAPATVTQNEEQTVAQAPVANDPTPVSPRPQPVSYPSGPSSGGDDGRVSSGGSGAGAILGTILGAVIRGGVVGDVDNCDPRTEGRARRLPNHQIPPIVFGGRMGTPSGIILGRHPGR
jgi:hypothetical protein